MAVDRQVGADCSGVNGKFYSHDKICDVGQYCNSKILKCVRTSLVGEDCDEFNSCEFGAGCFDDQITNRKYCKYLYSIPNGHQTMISSVKEFC